MRLLRFGSWLKEVLDGVKPELIAYEMPHNRGGSANAVLNQMVGKVEEAVAQAKLDGKTIEVAVYHSQTIKKAVLGYGGKGATKEMVIEKIKELYPDQRLENDDDQADALAVLYTTIKDLSL